jgi:hypothetical protein
MDIPKHDYLDVLDNTKENPHDWKLLMRKVEQESESRKKKKPKRGNTRNTRK